MTFTCTITKRSHRRALQAVSLRNTLYRWTVGFLCLIPVLVLAFPAARHESLIPFILANPFTVVGPPLIALVGFPLATYWTVASYHKNNRLMQTPQTFELTASGLITRGPLNNAELNWDAILQVVETRHSFLFYVGKNVAYFLPKDCLGAGQLNDIRSRLTEWLPGRVHLSRSRSGPAAA